jgi:glyoxylase I family protein
MAVPQLFAGIPITDLDAARAWYERLVGRAPDLVPNDTEVVWQLTDAGWIYVVADAERAGRGLITVMVDDLAEHVAGITARGLATEPIETVPGLFRRTSLTDPDGNRISFGEALS